MCCHVQMQLYALRVVQDMSPLLSVSRWWHTVWQDVTLRAARLYGLLQFSGHRVAHLRELSNSKHGGSKSGPGGLEGLLSRGINLSLADWHCLLRTSLGRGGVRTLCSPSVPPHRIPVQLPSVNPAQNHLNRITFRGIHVEYRKMEIAPTDPAPVSVEVHHGSTTAENRCAAGALKPAAQLSGDKKAPDPASCPLAW